MMLKQFFKKELIKLGYPDDLDIEYSLNSCQGDGVAFYGKIHEDNLEKLKNRIYSESENAVDRVEKLIEKKQLEYVWSVISEIDLDINYVMFQVDISKNSHGHRYSHYNCMDTTTETELDMVDDEVFDNIVEAGLQSEVTQDDVEHWQSIWSSFIKRIEADVKATSMHLESQGYRIVDNTPCEENVVWEFNTAQYTMQIVELPDHDFNIFDWDEDIQSSSLQSLLDGESRYLGLQARILDKESHDELSIETIYGLLVSKDDKTYEGNKREMMSEAIATLRSVLNANSFDLAA